MVAALSPRESMGRFAKVDAVIPSQYLFTDGSTPKSVWGASDWARLASCVGQVDPEAFLEPSLRRIELARKDDLIGHETRSDRFLLLGMSHIAGRPLSVKALSEAPLPGLPRIIISDGARGLPCLSDTGKCKWYFVNTTQNNWHICNGKFSKPRNVVQCILARFMKTGERIPCDENKSLPYICCRDDRYHTTTLGVGFKGDDLHIRLFTEIDTRYGS